MGRFFGQQQLFTLQFGDLAFIGLDYTSVVGLDDPLQERFDLLLGIAKLLCDIFLLLLRLGQAHVPGVLEHRFGNREDSPRRLKALQDISEPVLNLVTRNRFTLVLAAPRIAQIIGVVLRAAFRPARGHRLAAVIAQHEPAQREVFADVLAGGSLRLALHPLLNAFERLKTDDRLVMPSTRRHAPFGRFDIARIGKMRQKALDALPADFALGRILREGRLRLQKTLHLGLRLQMPCGKPFKCFGQDGCDWFIAHQNLPVTAIRDVLVTDWRGEDPIALLDPRLHLLDNLTAVLLTLKLALCGKDRLHELAFGRVIQLEVKAFDTRTARLELTAQLDVKLSITRKALQIIEDDDVVFVGLRIEIA